MGTYYVRGGRWYIGFQLLNGKMKYQSTGLKATGEKAEAKAKALLAAMEAQVGAQRKLLEGGPAGTLSGPLTVEAYAQAWLEKRERAGLLDVGTDRGRLRLHVLPKIGSLLLAEVRPHHIEALFEDVTARGLAPRTVHNIYGLVHTLFRDAAKKELRDGNPCMLGQDELGPNEDKDPEFRANAQFTRGELEQLISDPRLLWCRRIWYALAGLAALRLGEAAALCWRHYDERAEPLGRLLISRTHKRQGTKAGLFREMPVHPVLAAILGEWKLKGWEELMGRKPGPDDLVCPRPADQYDPAGKQYTKQIARLFIKAELAMLGMRHRRGHDLRRTMITLARSDGANAACLKTCTHNPSKKDTIDLYTTWSWADRCKAVGALRVRRLEGQVIPLVLASGGPAGGAGTGSYFSATSSPAKVAKPEAGGECEDRESNPATDPPGRSGGGLTVKTPATDSGRPTQAPTAAGLDEVPVLHSELEALPLAARLRRHIHDLDD